jgi:hypothetical protein
MATKRRLMKWVVGAIVVVSVAAADGVKGAVTHR